MFPKKVCWYWAPARASPWVGCRFASVNLLNGHSISAIYYVPRGVVTHLLIVAFRLNALFFEGFAQLFTV
jgi:hypothetical protein